MMFSNQIFRLLKIKYHITKHLLNRTVIGKHRRYLRAISYANPLSYRKHGISRGEAIRTALESLGPIFVKFAQVLSTRRDLIPVDIANELAKLQNQVPPFPSEIALKHIEKTFNASVDTLFQSFDEKPLASASIAQVHAITLNNGKKAILKILRPNIEKAIQRDIRLMHTIAKLLERFWSQGKRLRAVALVKEFEETTLDEINLIREAANATQLRRNFTDSSIMYVPEIFWDYTRENILVMERIEAVPISKIDTLQSHKTDMKLLAERGVEIFFTQVFRDSFFHADMHPGNLFVDCTNPKNPRYIGVDFGIMGSLSPEDQHYLAENLLAFFHRDYRRIAILHIESGWVPADTRIDQFESMIRTVSEPIFEKPLSEISFGQLLLQLFKTAERFKMPIQPQLMLLQKTLLYVEGLGRQLYPQLDLWETAKPFMENWVRERKSLRQLSKDLSADWQNTLRYLADTPRLAHHLLKHANEDKTSPPPKPNNRLISFLFGISTASLSLAFTLSLFPAEKFLHILSVIGVTGGLTCLGLWLFLE